MIANKINGDDDGNYNYNNNIINNHNNINKIIINKK